MYGRVVESLRSQAWKVHREVLLPHRYHDKNLEEARTFFGPVAGVYSTLILRKGHRVRHVALSSPHRRNALLYWKIVQHTIHLRRAAVHGGRLFAQEA